MSDSRLKPANVREQTISDTLVYRIIGLGDYFFKVLKEKQLFKGGRHVDNLLCISSISFKFVISCFQISCAHSIQSSMAMRRVHLSTIVFQSRVSMWLSLVLWLQICRVSRSVLFIYWTNIYRLSNINVTGKWSQYLSVAMISASTALIRYLIRNVLFARNLTNT